MLKLQNRLLLLLKGRCRQYRCFVRFLGHFFVFFRVQRRHFFRYDHILCIFPADGQHTRCLVFLFIHLQLQFTDYAAVNFRAEQFAENFLFSVGIRTQHIHKLALRNHDNLHELLPGKSHNLPDFFICFLQAERQRHSRFFLRAAADQARQLYFFRRAHPGRMCGFPASPGFVPVLRFPVYHIDIFRAIFDFRKSKLHIRPDIAVRKLTLKLRAPADVPS